MVTLADDMVDSAPTASSGCISLVLRSWISSKSKWFKMVPMVQVGPCYVDWLHVNCLMWKLHNIKTQFSFCLNSCKTTKVSVVLEKNSLTIFSCTSLFFFCNWAKRTSTCNFCSLNKYLYFQLLMFSTIERRVVFFAVCLLASYETHWKSKRETTGLILTGFMFFLEQCYSYLFDKLPWWC